MLSTTGEEALSGFTKFVVNGELMSYTTANLTATSQYDLTGLYRGQDNSTISAHANGSPFCRLDDAIAKIDLPAAYIGRTLYIKLVSFNPFGQGLQDISVVTPYTFTPVGASYGFNNALLNRLASGQPTDLGTLASTEGGCDLGNLTPPETAAVNLGSIA